MATTSKNAYEIRSDLLGLAKELADFNYSAKIQEYEYSIKKDGEQVVQEFKAPTMKAEDIIETAKKFNDFVTTGINVGESQKILMENVQKFSQNVQDAYKPEKIQENIKSFQENVKKFSEAFTNGVSNK